MSTLLRRVSSLSLVARDERFGLRSTRHYAHRDGVITPSTCSQDSFQDQRTSRKQAIRRARRQRRKHPFLRAVTYNVQHARGNSLNMALRAMDQMHVDFGVFTEIRLDHDMCAKFCSGCRVLSTKASRFQGGVAMFWQRTSDKWSVEGVQPFGPNVTRCSLVSGCYRWTVIGLCVPPSEDNGDTLNWLTLAVNSASKKRPIILMGDVNVDYSRETIALMRGYAFEAEDTRHVEIANAIRDLFVQFGMSDMSEQF